MVVVVTLVVIMRRGDGNFGNFGVVMRSGMVSVVVVTLVVVMRRGGNNFGGGDEKWWW